MTGFGLIDIQFEHDYRNFEQYRMYPLGYGKEPTMSELDRFIKDLRELASRQLPTIIKMPPNKVGLPEGTFIPESFLNYLADCLDGKIS